MLLDYLSKINLTLEKALRIFLIICMIVMVLVIGLQVFNRYFIKISLSWSEEVSRYMMVLITFLAAGLCLRHKQHIGVSIIVDFAPPKVRKVIRCGVYTILIVFYLILANMGYEIAANNIRQLSPALRFPMGILQMAIPVGMLFISLETVECFLREVFNKGGSG